MKGNKEDADWIEIHFVFLLSSQYGGAPVWVRTAAACQAACTADPNCYGWTFNIPSIATWDGPCYLKGTNNCDANVRQTAFFLHSTLSLGTEIIFDAPTLQSLTKVQTAGKYASGVIGDACTV